MSTFLQEFVSGHPVAVYDDKGRLFGIPCGFEQFDDGVSWSDDGVMQLDCSHHPHHHLYGAVDWMDGTIRCGGLTFAPAPFDNPKFAAAWNSLERDKWQWQSIHKVQNYELRLQRMRLSVERDQRR